MLKNNRTCVFICFHRTTSIFGSQNEDDLNHPNLKKFRGLGHIDWIQLQPLRLKEQDISCQMWLDVAGGLDLLKPQFWIEKNKLSVWDAQISCGKNMCFFLLSVMVFSNKMTPEANHQQLFHCSPAALASSLQGLDFALDLAPRRASLRLAEGQ